MGVAGAEKDEATASGGRLVLVRSERLCGEKATLYLKRGIKKAGRRCDLLSPPRGWMVNASCPWADKDHCHSCWDFEFCHLCREE